MQKQAGDKFQVLLLSVDLGYEPDETKQKEYIAGYDKEIKEACDDAKAAWPCGWPVVLLPKGFAVATPLFNSQGYSSFVVGPDGVVQAVNTDNEEELPKLVKKLLADPPKPEPAKPDAPTPSKEGPSGDAHVGAPCPPFSFKTQDGKTVTLDDYKGKPFLMDVWSTG